MKDADGHGVEFVRADIADDLLEALKAAANSAGFQYMTAETRAMIDDALASAGAA